MRTYAAHGNDLRCSCWGGARAIAAPQGRTHRSAAALLRWGRRGCPTLPDHRGGATAMSWTAALMAAFARFSRTSPSLLAFDKARAEGHVATSDGMARVPCDTPRRTRLDAVCPAS